MFNSDESRFAREVVKEIMKEQNRNSELGHEISDAHAVGIIAVGGALAIGLVKPAIYTTAISIIGTSLFPIGVAMTAFGVVGLGTQVVKKRMRGK